MEILPSIISGDILNFEKTIKTLESHCDGFHIDVMDDHFVPNLTFGPMFVNAFIKATNRPMHIHLMVEEPDSWLDRIEPRKNDIFIFHYESMEEDEIWDLIKDARSLGCEVGLAFNPSTGAENIAAFLKQLDHVLVMSVEPGFSGQKFIDSVLDKVGFLINEREKNNLKFKIGMDGGISLENIKKIKDLGVDQVGVASSIFSDGDPVNNLKNLYSKCS